MKLLEITKKEKEYPPLWHHYKKIADDLAYELYSMLGITGRARVAFYFGLGELASITISDDENPIDQFQKKLFVQFVEKKMKEITPDAKVKAGKLEVRSNNQYRAKRSAKRSWFYIDVATSSKDFLEGTYDLPMASQEYSRYNARLRKQNDQ